MIKTKVKPLEELVINLKGTMSNKSGKTVEVVPVGKGITVVYQKLGTAFNTFLEKLSEAMPKSANAYVVQGESRQAPLSVGMDLNGYDEHKIFAFVQPYRVLEN